MHDAKKAEIMVLSFDIVFSSSRTLKVFAKSAGIKRPKYLI
tara:strand:- start:681 stop:803 length:123 start_codon:yes stop_codon:yes gene_type:complete